MFLLGTRTFKYYPTLHPNIPRNTAGIFIVCNITDISDTVCRYPAVYRDVDRSGARYTVSTVAYLLREKNVIKRPRYSTERKEHARVEVKFRKRREIVERRDDVSKLSLTETSLPSTSPSLSISLRL